MIHPEISVGRGLTQSGQGAATKTTTPCIPLFKGGIGGENSPLTCPSGTKGVKSTLDCIECCTLHKAL